MGSLEIDTEYLQLSARTAANPNGISMELFANTPAALLSEVMDFAISGAKADAIKRSMFYKESNEKLDARLLNATKLHEKMFEELKSLKGADIKLLDEEIDLLHAILGIQSEVGELVEEFINAKLEGREVDFTNFKEEGGDVMWYLALLFRTIETTFGETAFSNIEKLKVRFPILFSTEDALNRDLDAEKAAMETGSEQNQSDSEQQDVVEKVASQG